MKPKAYMMIAGLAVFTLLSGCTSAPAGNTEATAHTGQHETNANQQHAASGDLQEMTSSVKQLPSFLGSLDPRITQAYQIAAENRDLLKSIPCYCGCADIGHQSNYNCFFKEERTDGSIVWDDHGTRCGTCMEIAVYSAQLKQEGKSTKEIRTMIDEVYKEGYAPPTPTPMPM